MEQHPEWLTKELVNSFLQESGEEVASYDIQLGSAPGDNFLSVIYRMTITTTKGTQHNLIVKTTMEGEEASAATVALEAFPKEIQAYKDLLPSFERIWLEHSGQPLSIGPKCYFATTESPLAMIVMEDLRPRGFKSRDRKVGFDLREMKSVFATAAKFHACSVKRVEESGPLDEHLYAASIAREGLKETFSVYYGSLFEQYLWGIERHVDNGSQYLPKLQKLRDRQFDVLQQSTASDPSTLNVLCHADLWVNNILFNEKDPEDVKFIDYQISQWTSPAIDLIYAIFTSCQPEVIVNEWENLIRFYWGELQKAMKTVKVEAKVPSFEEFLKEMEKRSVIGSVLVTETLALSKADASLDLGLGALIGQTPEAVEVREKIFSSPDFIHTMNLLLPFMDKKGFLDV